MTLVMAAAAFLAKLTADQSREAFVIRIDAIAKAKAAIKEQVQHLSVSCHRGEEIIRAKLDEVIQKSIRCNFSAIHLELKFVSL